MVVSRPSVHVAGAQAMMTALCDSLLLKRVGATTAAHQASPVSGRSSVSRPQISNGVRAILSSTDLGRKTAARWPVPSS